MSVAYVLRSAREMLADPAHWTQGAHARDADGKVTHTSDSKATCWCLEGALIAAVRRAGLYGRGVSGPFTALSTQLTPTSGTIDLARWNDAPERKHEEVLALLDQTIEAIQ